MPRPPQLPPKPLGNCYIDLLPNELLAHIVAYLPPKKVLRAPPTYEQCPPIALVCKHWEHIYTTTLYRTITFHGHPWQQHRTAKVLKTLRQQPDLRRHVRNIFVMTYRQSEATCRQIAYTIRSCYAIRTLSLHLTWSADAWPIIYAAEMLPRLVVLKLSGCDSGPSLQMILTHFNQPTLRDLRISNYGLGRDSTPSASYSPNESPSQDDMEKFSILAHSHSTPITSLELHDPLCMPPCIGIFLRWPSNLTRLSLSGLTSSTYEPYYTLDAVERILGFHHESLQHISVSVIPGWDEQDGWIDSGIPDFSKFKSLREVQLSAHNLLTEKPSQAAAKLAAPGLRHLALTFGAEVESWTSFDYDEVHWMVRFARKNQIREPKTSLQSIFIDFKPGLEILSTYGILASGWPWYYLQQAQKELSRYDLTMRYSDPIWTKDEWDQRRRMEQEAETEAMRALQSIENSHKTLERGGAWDGV